jgi:uncharacterized coiled-coil DUF342 family protein
MKDDVRGTIEGVIAELGARLEHAKRALRGESEFEAENVRQLRATIEKMGPIVAKADELRREYPDIAARLDHYKCQLKDLQTTTHQLQVVLLAKQASLIPSQSQNVAVSRWVTAFQQTR